jgi:gamma-glutamylcyclotransferase
MSHYFAYGSNMNSQRMQERGIPFSKPIRAQLANYKLAFNKQAYRNPSEGYANILPFDGEIVHGVLYCIPESGLDALDRFEGAPNHYRRSTVTVQAEGGCMLQVLTYVAHSNRVRSGLKPSPSYLNHLLAAGAMLPKGYLKQLEQYKTLGD